MFTLTNNLVTNSYYFRIILPSLVIRQGAILGFMEEIQDQHNIIINHILLITKICIC